MNTDWNIQKRSAQCVQCEKDFQGADLLHCYLNLQENEPLRQDYCVACWKGCREEKEKASFFHIGKRGFVQELFRRKLSR